MIEIILLALISGLSIYGLYWIYNKYEDQDDVKKMVAVFLAIIVVLMSSFLVFSATTREIAMGQAAENQSILSILLGMSGGGYSPYIKESWGGGQGPEQDFDWDGIKNAWDQDADNDGINDAWEHGTRFNPFQPDVGIKDFEIRWITDDEVHVRCYSVQDFTGFDCKITLYLDNIIQQEKSFSYMADFYVDVDPEKQYTLEVKVDGTESNYANKVNNIYSYTIPAGIYGVLGRWYSNLESTLQGVIRNNPLFYAANAFGMIENLFRQGIMGIPLFLWILIIAAVLAIVLINRRRRKKGKPPLLSFGRKKERFEKGSTRIQLY